MSISISRSASTVAVARTGRSLSVSRGNKFSPFELSGLQLWLKAGVGMYQDVAGTTPAVADDDPVGLWQDQSSNNRDVTQATENKRPLLKLAIINNRPVVRFDGSNDILLGAIPTGGNKTLFVVSKKNSAVTTTTQVCVSLGPGDLASLYVDLDFGTGWMFYDTGPGINRSRPVGYNATYQFNQMTIKWTSGGVIALYFNGYQFAGDTPIAGYANYNQIALGAKVDASLPGDMDIAEIVLYDTALSDVNRVKVENYLKFKYDLAPVWARQGTVLEATEDFEYVNVGEPTVLYEGNPQILTGETNVFKMWYAAGGWGQVRATGYAESTDGITWIKYASNPVLTGYARHCVLNVGGTYYFYASTTDHAIDLLTSPDGLDWTLDTASVLTKSAPTAWDDDSIENTFVWKEGADDWRMVYDAKGGGLPYQTGYATSADGRAWTKYASNPVIATGDGLSSAGSNPWVTKIGSAYWLWCHGSMLGALPSDIYRYTSTVLTTWTRTPWPIVLARLSTDEGAMTTIGQASDLCIAEVNNKTYMFYCGSSDGSSEDGHGHVKLAIADMPLADLVATDEGY